MKRSIFLSFISIIVFLWSCECEDLTPTVVEEFPDPFLVIEYGVVSPSIGNILPIFFQFNDEIDTSTVQIGQNVLFEGLDQLVLSSSFGNNLSFSGVITGCDINASPCNGEVTVTLKGTGESVIRSLDGQVLDGDFDGSDGGDFVKTFEF